VLSLSLVRYVLTAALRDKVVWGVVAISLLAVCLSLFTANSAIIEKTQFAIVFMAGSLRLLTLFGLLLFVVFFIRRSFDARDVEFFVDAAYFTLFLCSFFFSGLFIDGSCGGDFSSSCWWGGSLSTPKRQAVFSFGP
jgi:uncharacterized membrane protein